MLDAVATAGSIEGMAPEPGCRPIAVLRQVGELDAVVGKNSVDLVRHSFDKCIQEGRGGFRVGPFLQPHECELACLINGNEQVQLALFSSHLSNIDVEIADRIAFEPLLRLSLRLWQAADTMTLEEPMKGRARLMWDRRLKSI